MVMGIDVFKEYFKDHNDKYVLIGGAACDILMGEMGLEFRTTKDIDIILIIEALDPEFGRVFWNFIKKGGYENIQKSTNEKEFYRFNKPRNSDFPFMIELFSRKPDILQIPEGATLSAIPFDEEVSSLSAILLDAEFYKFIINGRREIDGLPLIDKEYLIPMKVRAFLDLSNKKEKGEKVDNDDIKKHRRDVFRLLNILTPGTRVELPQLIADDMNVFIEKMKQDPPDLKNLKLGKKTIPERLSDLREVYQMENKVS
ncbi:MAG TPA: hypothetical protein VHO03_06045 [Ignavibacteriales bacterium]|nr:hypothetical protein [Ignavibacteriales bacterium]